MEGTRIPLNSHGKKEKIFTWFTHRLYKYIELLGKTNSQQHERFLILVEILLISNGGPGGRPIVEIDLDFFGPRHFLLHMLLPPSPLLKGKKVFLPKLQWAAENHKRLGNVNALITGGTHAHQLVIFPGKQ